MFRKMTLLLALMAITVCSVSAQNAAMHWHFGYRAHVDFTTSTPTATVVSTINTLEGSSSISDSMGAPSFHTDGMTVWNKNNVPMTNGTGLMGNSSSTQSALIVPCSCDKSAIFTTDDAEHQYNNGLRYSVVDMTQSAGLGAVTVKNVLLLPKASEKIAGFRDANGVAWVVAHRMYTNQFFAYRLNDGDCKLNPQAAVISAVGAVYTGGTADFGQGQMKFSPNGDFIAHAGLTYGPGSFVELFQFDKNTGVVSNFGSTTARDSMSSNDGFYGIEFSPDSNVLYATTTVANSNVYRYGNITVNKLTSRTQISSFGNAQYTVAALQLAPDGKIYVARKNYASLYVLSAPNTANGGWSTTPFNLAGGSLSQLGLPAVVAGNFSCGPAPDVCCDKLRVSPYPNPPLNQDYRTFEVFNFKQPTSPICSIDIDMQPAPPTTLWQGGMAFQNLNGTNSGPLNPVNFVFASNPPAYRRIPTLAPNMMSALSNPITTAAVKFNLGFDNTQAYNGVTKLTVNHCDGTKCILEYKPWIVSPQTPGGGFPWSVDVRELNAELIELTLTYQGGGARTTLPQNSRGAKWFGLQVLNEGMEIYTIDGPGVSDERSKKFSLNSSIRTTSTALFEFSGLLSLNNREQIGRTITLLIKKKAGARFDSKQLRSAFFDEDANTIIIGRPQP